MRGRLRAVKGRERYWEIAVDAGRDPITGGLLVPPKHDEAKD